jgi:predicted  nucleic acid-binding Zn-ribbon protein
MKIKMLVIAFLILITIGGVVISREFKSVRLEIEKVEEENVGLETKIKNLSLKINVANKMLQLKRDYNDYAKLNHDHFDYAQTVHKHKYAEVYHFHSRYVKEDDFEELQRKVGLLSSKLINHEYDTSKHKF